MKKERRAVTVAQKREEEIEPGKIKFHIVGIEQASVSQKFVDRLRAIGADPEAVEFAQRQVPPIESEAGTPEATA